MRFCYLSIVYKIKYLILKMESYFLSKIKLYPIKNINFLELSIIIIINSDYNHPKVSHIIIMLLEISFFALNCYTSTL